MRSTSLAFSPASERFHDDLVEEHIDDGSFLYGQRRGMLAESDESWTRVAGVEQRIEAHVDALVVAGRRASERCAVRAGIPDEPGALFLATCVLCRRRDASRMAQLLAGVGNDERERIDAVRDALQVELPEPWTRFVEDALSGSKSQWIAVFADVSGHRRLPIANALIGALDRNVATPEVARALGRLRAKEAGPALWRCLASSDDAARSAAILALLRLGDREALACCADLARDEAWAHEAIGPAGGQVSVRTLLRAMEGGRAQQSTIEAVGLLGDPVVIPSLLAALASEDLAPCAARSLHWLTGAAMVDESFVADDIDEAALTASELEAWRTKKERPLRSDGRPFGTTVRALSRDPRRWRLWLDSQPGKFPPGKRYRLGIPCTPGLALECLLDPGTDGRLRRGTALELEIRYGCNVPFDVTLPVVMQRSALARMNDWVSVQGHRFAPGQWTFGGSINDVV
jgi:uncharacterized protein (TIGR02270 family)